jgi:hypothetical protein
VAVKGNAQSTMHLLLFSTLLSIALAAPTITFDYLCMPNIVCGIMIPALASGGVGLSSIGSLTITGTSPLHRASVDNHICPKKKCNGSSNACFEYPFPSAKESGNSNVRCVSKDEINAYHTALTSFYGDNNIQDGDPFYISLKNVDQSGCMEMFI